MHSKTLECDPCEDEWLNIGMWVDLTLVLYIDDQDHNKVEDIYLYIYICVHSRKEKRSSN